MCERIQVPTQTIQEGKGHALLIPGHLRSWSLHSWREINSPPCRALSLCLRTFPKLSEAKEFSQWQKVPCTHRGDIWRILQLISCFPVTQGWSISEFTPAQSSDTRLPAWAAFQTVLLRLLFLSPGSHLLSNYSVNIHHSTEGFYFSLFSYKPAKAENERLKRETQWRFTKCNFYSPSPHIHKSAFSSWEHINKVKTSGSGKHLKGIGN